MRCARRILVELAMHRIHRALILAFSLFVVLGGRAAWGFSAQGHAWPDADQAPVSFMVDPNGSRDAGAAESVEAVRRAFATWTGVACSSLAFEEQTFEPSSDQARNVIANDGKHRVYWAETEAEWPGDRGTLALTYTFYTLDQRRAITDADIVANGVNWDWTTDQDAAGQGQPAKVDVETVMLHEIGHFFGLDHSQDPGAAMFASNNKVLQRAPANDDVEGICALYSNGEPLPHNPGAGSGAPLGAPCLAHSNCASSVCVSDPAYDESYCSKLCTPGGTECDSGFECTPSGNQAYCLKPEPIDELCDQCNLHSHCASGLCATVPFRNGGAPFCTKPCDPTPGQPSQCPQGYQCEVTQQQTTQIAVCVPTNGVCQPQGKGGHLEPCFGNGTCKPGHGCFAYNEALSFCYALCDIRAVGQSCGTSRSLCSPVGGVANTAACFEIAFPGEPCIPEQCDPNSLCAEDGSGVESALCYQVCPSGLDRECPPNYDCQSFPDLAAPVCVPLDGFKSIGASCASDAECESQMCRIIGENRLCTQLCATTDDQCGPGLLCVPPTGSTQGICWPRSYLGETPADRDRTAEVLPGYCGCDRTSQCDRNCDCDPECTGGCTDVGPVAARPSGFPTELLWAGLLGAAFWATSRRRRRG